MTKEKVTVRRRTISSLTDADRYSVLKGYAEGVDVKQMARQFEVSDQELSKFIQSHLRSSLITRETNELMQTTNKNVLGNAVSGTITKCLTPAFIAKVEENMDIYAYYYVQSGDNEFAIKESGLDIGIPPNLRAAHKNNILKIRGQFIRDIPVVKKYIREEQDRRMAENNIDKVYVQRELIDQIDQLKMLAVDDSRQRANLLKSIEMLGKTIGAFTERVEIEETDAKKGLDILMERIKQEEGVSHYEASESDIEATDNDPDVLP